MATNRRQKKTSTTRKVKVTHATSEIKNHAPCEEEIRELAEILFHQRIDRGKPGSALDDWFKAETNLRSPEK